jgi:ZIP family zinc transporter
VHIFAQQLQRIMPFMIQLLVCVLQVTMSLHNLPEGCAVAFSAFTDFGAKMAVAIAVHNM